MPSCDVDLLTEPFSLMQVTDANFDCSPTGFALQAMDISHISLVSLYLRHDGFEHYRCDRNISMGEQVSNCPGQESGTPGGRRSRGGSHASPSGMNLNNLAKMLKCAGNEDIITIKAADQGDTVTFMFESPSQDKISDFELKLMDIDSEHLVRGANSRPAAERGKSGGMRRLPALVASPAGPSAPVLTGAALPRLAPLPSAGHPRDELLCGDQAAGGGVPAHLPRPGHDRRLGHDLRDQGQHQVLDLGGHWVGQHHHPAERRRRQEGATGSADTERPCSSGES